MCFLKSSRSIIYLSLLASISFVQAGPVNGDFYQIVRGEPSREPINFLDNDGNPAGFEKDILDEIAKRANIEIKEEFVPTLSSSFERIDNHEIDMVLSALSITPERQEHYEFSDGYLLAHPVTIVTKDSEIRSVEDLKGKKVSVKAGTTHQKMLQALLEESPETELIVEGSTFLAVKDVIQGKADATIGDDVFMLSFIEKYVEYELIAVVDESFDDQEYGILLAKDNMELRDKINGALKEVKEDGTYEELLHKWYPEKGE